MYRTKDFMMMDVTNVKGKKVGFVKDILININEGRITGFLVSPYNLFVRSTYVKDEDIISLGESMIIKKTVSKFSMNVKELKGMDVIDSSGNIIGVLEDIIFDSEYKIKGLIISAGIISKILYGKRIILVNEVLVGEKYILYLGDGKKVVFLNLPHKYVGVECDEKKI